MVAGPPSSVSHRRGLPSAVKLRHPKLVVVDPGPGAVAGGAVRSVGMMVGLQVLLH